MSGTAQAMGHMAQAGQTAQVANGQARQQPTTRSLLIVDCGSAHTKVALLGLVEGRYRLLAQAQAPTTQVPPVADVSVGVREAIAGVERITGRTLLREGRLITPEQDDGSGVDGMALATSVGGPLRLLATGPGREALTGLVYRSIGGLFAQVEALPSTSPHGGAPSAEANTAEWRQMVAVAQALRPHAALVVGSPFGMARGQSSLEETAQTLARWLDALREPTMENAGEPGRYLPVVFTGSASDAATLQGALGGRATAQQVEALSPSTLAPLNRAVNALYEGAVLRGLPGYAPLRAMATTTPSATVTALAGLVRYLAQHYQTSVVGVDVGARSTALAGATAQGEFLPAMEPNAGVGAGAGHILRARGAQAILQWLSEAVSEDEVREYALTRMLRPQALPLTARELEMEHAFAREAILLALRAPGARLAGLHPLDVALGTGGALANVPHPAMAALMLLDALQPRGVTALALDTAHIATMLGGVAGLDALAAADVAESDAALLRLGTAIAPVGVVPEGELMVRVTLEFADGRRVVEDVTQGKLLRLPLAQGEQATLGLYPAATVDVGLGPGQQARASEAVEGGALGLIVDARGRPLALATDAAERMERTRGWRRAMGLEV